MHRGTWNAEVYLEIFNIVNIFIFVVAVNMVVTYYIMPGHDIVKSS